MNFLTRMVSTLLVLMMASLVISCKKKFEIRDIDPGKPGTVRSLGPESQDVLAVADQMVRSLVDSGLLAKHSEPPVIHMLPMENNTRHAFSQEIFTSNLKLELNRLSERKMIFRAGDVLSEVQKEREMKRDGQVDYDPEMRTQALAGADYFLKGRADGLSGANARGESETILYTFKLINAESGLEVWEDGFMTKKEGNADRIYR